MKEKRNSKEKEHEPVVYLFWTVFFTKVVDLMISKLFDQKAERNDLEVLSNWYKLPTSLL